MKPLAIIQARMSSSRLPGKVLLEIGGSSEEPGARGGVPMLVRVVERARRAQNLDGVIVATTTDPSDDPLVRLCAERGYPCWRGSLHDVLDRYYQAARAFNADVIVRLTADCPVLDPDLVDRTVAMFMDHCDFAANRLPPPWGRTLPIGLDVEVCSFTALEHAWKEADQPFQREHVMPYFYEGIPPDALQPVHHPQPAASQPYSVSRARSPRGFQVAQLHHTPDYGNIRWTVDTPADLELIRQIYARFGGRDDFSWLEVLALFEREPELAQINASVQHKTAFDVDSRRNQ